MFASHRRATARLLAVAAVSALALTACGDGESPAATATAPGASASASDAKATPSAGGAEPARSADTDGTAAPSAPADGTSKAPAGGGDSAAAPKPTEGAAPRWAGTKQFVQLEKAWTRDGRTYVSVRPARKEVDKRFDAWVIVPGEGPYTTVRLTKEARVLLTVQVRGDDGSGAGRGEAVPYSQTDFVTKLDQVDPKLRPGIGYDLSFDGQGDVVKLQSLYTA
jgi:hypothetical protein